MMSDVRKAEKGNTVLDLGPSLAQVTSEATRRLCEQGQTVAETVTDLNTEMSNFLSQRLSRNTEIIARFTNFQALPDVFAIQAQWMQDAAADYLKEMSKLVEVNTRIMSSLMGSVGQGEARSSPAKSSLRAAS
jgi:predicted Rossmann fold nucleotide-binding protein DprA/Smf involved in DNA uptake